MAAKETKTKEVKTIKVYVKQDVEIMVNGHKEKIEKGVQELSKGKAQILIDAGYADIVEDK